MKRTSRNGKIAMRRRVLAGLVFIALPLFGSVGGAHAEDRGLPPTAAENQNWVVSLGGKLKHPKQLDREALQRLPAEQVKVSYQAGRGVEEASFTGVPLWTLLVEAGGIVVLSTGEIAPDFGAKPALLAYRRNDETVPETGFRLVMPGDKHGAGMSGTLFPSTLNRNRARRPHAEAAAHASSTPIKSPL